MISDFRKLEIHKKTLKGKLENPSQTLTWMVAE